MTDRLSPEREAEIAARAEAASPSPWFLHADWPGRVFSESEFNHHIARVTGTNPERNEAFIAHAREDVPALLAELAAVRTELAKYVGKEPTIAEEMEHLGRCLNAVYDLCDKAEKQAGRWEHPLPVPAWVEQVRAAADGVRPDDPSDNRRRIYIDGKGNGWIDLNQDPTTGERNVTGLTDQWQIKSTDSVLEATGSLREIGRCW
ncbi:hypothetical protein [Streptomyces sp. NPDC056242]|uniref:hypothetical protein n=1 Tax=Streptomyces sp. NPDC056242 TaxID=3345760 RepID=UPI0035D8C187